MYSNIYAPFLSTTFSQFLNISWYWSSGRRSNTKSKLDNSTNNLRKARHACCAACSLSVNVGLQCNFFAFQGRLCRRGGICAYPGVLCAEIYAGFYLHKKKVLRFCCQITRIKPSCWSSRWPYGTNRRDCISVRTRQHHAVAISPAGHLDSPPPWS
jgi:hypothetical protein